MMYKVVIGLVAVVAVASVAMAFPGAQTQAISLEDVRLVSETQHVQDLGRGESTVCKESAVSEMVKESCYKNKDSRSYSGRDLPQIQLAFR